MNFQVYETFLANFKDAQEICQAKHAELMRVASRTQLTTGLLLD